ncbi:MAG TPA: NAD-dependent succinate-semialdehyde dehydrogenase [Bryobacteraceae bacterium]|nr:NAD-dependent succinate-semialdehyde dehydrogenase [Bryobacteraceae bacterium]
MTVTESRLALKRNELLLDSSLIAGERKASADGATFAVRNPATGEILTHVPDCTASDASFAVDAAVRAFPDWRARTAKERSAVLKAWHALLMANQEDLARIISLEEGKPLTESRGEVAYGAAFVEWFAEEAKRAYGEVIPENVRGRKLIVVKEPVGVVAAVTPWNFPIAMLTRKAAPALAVGCTFISKPAEDTPLSALAIAMLAQEAGVPAGVLNVVTASRERTPAVVERLLNDTRVRKLTFTGSTAVGKLLLRQSADTLKRVSLELGGNAPFIVFDDADVDAAVSGAIAAKFRNTGQTCVCANRILVQSRIYDLFAQKMADAVSHLRVAPATQPDAEQGPLINERALKKVEDHLRDAVARGARVLVGGKRHPAGPMFFEPTVIADATSEMKLAGEETFGPIAPLFRFDDEAEAIRLANDTPFGLAAYFYARDIGRVWRVAAALEAGMVGINEGIISTEVAPFGGVKESGIGREGARQGMEEYQNLKYLCMGGLGS